MKPLINIESTLSFAFLGFGSDSSLTDAIFASEKAM
jgi:hypothetical protein